MTLDDRTIVLVPTICILRFSTCDLCVEGPIRFKGAPIRIVAINERQG